MKKRASNEPFERRYSPDDLRALYCFCQSDFERLMDLMVWLESLPEDAADEQVSSARKICGMEATGESVKSREKAKRRA